MRHWVFRYFQISPPLQKLALAPNTTFRGNPVPFTTLNSSPSEYRQTVQIIRSAKLTVLFNIGSQWSVSREIVRIKCSDELSVVNCICTVYDME